MAFMLLTRLLVIQVMQLKVAEFRQLNFYKIPSQVMTGRQISSLFVEGRIQCASYCIAKASCHGYNYKQDDNGTCELQDAIAWDTSRDLVPSSYYHHYTLYTECPFCHTCWYQSCYYVGPNSLQLLFSEALTQCTGLGGKLAELETLEESDFVKDLISSIIWSDHTGFFLGADRQLGDPRYYWLTTGAIVDATFNDWGSYANQPNYNTDRCVMFYRAGSEKAWHDHYYTERSGYVCEFTIRD